MTNHGPAQFAKLPIFNCELIVQIARHVTL